MSEKYLLFPETGTEIGRRYYIVVLGTNIKHPLAFLPANPSWRRHRMTSINRADVWKYIKFLVHDWQINIALFDNP